MNATGVLPVIFASSLLAVPSTLARFTHSSTLAGAANALGPGGAFYLPVRREGVPMARQSAATHCPRSSPRAGAIGTCMRGAALLSCSADTVPVFRPMWIHAVRRAFQCGQLRAAQILPLLLKRL